MAKYRKKPIVIDAIQYIGDNKGEIRKFAGNKMSTNTCYDHLTIHTLEGTMTAHVGDWIVKGIKGEFYPVDNIIFELSYEKVDDTSDMPTVTAEGLKSIPSAGIHKAWNNR